jgi:serine protease AprX
MDIKAKQAGRDGMLTAGRLLPLIAAIALTVTGPATQALAESGRSGRVSESVDRRIHDAAPDALIPVVVQTRGPVSDGHLARLHGRGGTLKTKHNAIDGYSALVPAGAIGALADDPDVDRISYDFPVHAFMDVALRAVRGDLAPAGPGGLDGRGIGIALIDTGVANHDDLDRGKGPAQVTEVEFIGHESGLADYFGHGTHVAGILSGSGADSSGPDAFRTFRGVAPGARLLSLRALRPDGTGTTSDVLAAIDWVQLHRRSSNIRIVNLSLGHPIEESYTTDPLCRALRGLVASGVVVVVAAGNGGRTGSGFGTIMSPGNDPSVITVGAMDTNRTVAREDDILAPYSAKGPTLVDQIVKPDLVAPGSFIVSLRATGSWLDLHHHELVLRTGDYSTAAPRDGDGAYMTLSGTSMSAPMVSGAAALLLQQNPSLDPADVKARLMATAVKDDLMPFETGAGYLDIAAALASTARADAALSPRALPGADGALAYFPPAGSWNGNWDQTLIWGGGRRLGTEAATENDRVTASGLVWGGGPSLDALTLVWGGGQSVEASTLVWGGGQ